jgi:hypothetical protein
MFLLCGVLHLALHGLSFLDCFSPVFLRLADLTWPSRAEAGDGPAPPASHPLDRRVPQLHFILQILRYSIFYMTI